MPIREGGMPRRSSRPIFDSLCSAESCEAGDWTRRSTSRKQAEGLLQSCNLDWGASDQHSPSDDRVDEDSPTARVRAYVAADLVAYVRKGLSNKVLQKLQKASLSRSQRAELLRRLFADVALDIDLRAQDVLSTTGSYQFMARSPSPPPSTGPSPRQRSSLRTEGSRAGGEAEQQQEQQQPGGKESQGGQSSPRIQAGNNRDGLRSAAAVGLAQEEAGRANDAGGQDGDRAYERCHSSSSSRSSSSCCKGSSEEGEARVDSSNEVVGKEGSSDGEGGGEKWEEDRGRSMQRDARQSSRARAQSLTAVIAAAGSGSGKWCFYEVLAAGYEAQPEEAEELLPLFAPLWSIPFCSQVFTLLLHRWLFSFPNIPSNDMVRYMRAFITGCDSIFWIDVQSNKRRFSPLFEFVLTSVVMDRERFSRVPQSYQKDIFCLVARFLFLYDADSRLHHLLHSVGCVEALRHAAADIYVMELTNQLQVIKVEPVLRLYLQRCADLKAVDLGPVAATRLQVALFSMASPGGPLFPTPAVRAAARAALDTICPDFCCILAQLRAIN